VFIRKAGEQEEERMRRMPGGVRSAWNRGVWQLTCKETDGQKKREKARNKKEMNVCDDTAKEPVFD
jgi:hypothetical protein